MSHKPQLAVLMAAPNVIPMADIMLVLLIIFMVITPMITQGHPVNMASAQNAEKMPYADHDDAVIVAITRDGHVFLSPGNKEIASSQLRDDVKDLLVTRMDKTVYVRSDARARYGDVVKAVDELRAIGVENIGMLTEKIPGKPPSPPVEKGWN
jgi:biopolymer transport protein ExbD